MKTIGIVIAVIVLVGAAFWGGGIYANAGTSAAGTGPGAGVDGQGRGAGGPMADLTDDERAQIESMTDEERQEFLAEKFDGQVPTGGPGGIRGGTIDGEVLEVAQDTVTLKLTSGSQTVYYDGDTTIAYEGGAAKLAAGSQILVIAEPAADGVTNASVIVVKK
ncbi:MAG: hypothetical protein KJ747_00970 [Actinobacteria bacterium]|nr:hypothetical protein [Actinomycetota bacterium]